VRNWFRNGHAPPAHFVQATFAAGVYLHEVDRAAGDELPEQDASGSGRYEATPSGI